RSVRIVENIATREEPQRARALKDRTEPFGFGAHVHQGDAAIVPAHPLDELPDDAAIERRVDPHATEPWERKPVLAFGVRDLRTVPRARIVAGRIEIEFTKRIEDCPRRDPHLALADR